MASCPTGSRSKVLVARSLCWTHNHQLVKENEDLRDQVRALQDELELQELRDQAQCK